MNRIDKLFAQKNKNVLGVYYTAGFPELNSTSTILSELQNSGVDMIEVGMPFSDPLADGPVIQESSSVALEGGMSIRKLFAQLKTMRETIHVPVVLMGYLNPVLQFGFEKFMRHCADCGIDGLILPDLPIEEFENAYRPFFEVHGVHPIFLISPRTPAERVKKIAGLSKGFVYLVSSSSTTGTAGEFSQEQKNAIQRTSELVNKIPVVVGFGIHNGKTFHDATDHTNGGIVGTAFIRQLQSSPDIQTAVRNTMNQLNITQYDRSTY